MRLTLTALARTLSLLRLAPAPQRLLTMGLELPMASAKTDSVMLQLRKQQKRQQLLLLPPLLLLKRPFQLWLLQLAHLLLPTTTASAAAASPRFRQQEAPRLAPLLRRLPQKMALAMAHLPRSRRQRTTQRPPLPPPRVPLTLDRPRRRLRSLPWQRSRSARMAPWWIPVAARWRSERAAAMAAATMAAALSLRVARAPRERLLPRSVRATTIGHRRRPSGRTGART
jgi:hypothetical protein